MLRKISLLISLLMFVSPFWMLLQSIIYIEYLSRSSSSRTGMHLRVLLHQSMQEKISLKYVQQQGALIQGIYYERNPGKVVSHTTHQTQLQ